MKHFVLLIISCTCYCITWAQWFPGSFYSSVGHFTSSIGNNRVLYGSDSVFYCLNDDITLQSINLNTGKIEYEMVEVGNANEMWPDTGNGFIYLRNNQVKRFNISTARAEGDTLATNVSKIVVAKGSLWVKKYNTVEVRVGGNWHAFNIQNATLVGATDSIAYILMGKQLYKLDFNGDTTPVHQLATAPSAVQSDLDSAGNVWIVASGVLLKIKDTAVTVYGNNTVASARFNTVVADNIGHVYAITADNAVQQFVDTGWTVYAGVAGNNLAIDKTTGKLFVLSDDTIITITDQLRQKYLFNNWPYTNLRALSGNMAATSNGVFSFYPYNSFRPLYLISPATNATCFSVLPFGTSSSPYIGTTNGIENFNNAILPDTQINYIYDYEGSLYIGTNKGICIYNQLVSTVFDTSNSPLPSNKITFITATSQYINGIPINSLYVGTDNGLAIYKNSSWQVFDTTNIATSNFHVTGILPPSNNFITTDTTTWITTLGGGLIKLAANGNYEVWNVANGKIEDDTLNYLLQVGLAKCGEYILIGTAHHGIMARESYWWNSLDFNYINTTTPFTGTDSMFQSNYGSFGSFGSLLYTEKGILYSTACGSTQKITAEKLLNWRQQNGRVIIELPIITNEKVTIHLYDISGKLMAVNNTVADNKVEMDVSSLSSGMYLAEIYAGREKYRSKVIVNN